MIAEVASPDCSNRADRPGGPSPERRLLLAEDDETLGRLMAQHLEADGWRVDTVVDGPAAVTHVRQQQPDVLLLDMRLPGLDGLGVLDAIRHEARVPPVVLMSGYLDVQSTLAALQRGVVEVLEKPFDSQRLLDVVRGVDDRREERSSRTQRAPHRRVPDLVGRSHAIGVLREQIVVASRYADLPVMIIGETGTGKELVARAIHRLGGAQGRLLSINCAAMPESLFESEVFGHEAGAFTGARGARAGLLEAAGSGTVFLDEVGEMPASQQAKLLRVLETRTFRRLGSSRELPLRARIVSATNRPLQGREGEAMRADLFFRLAGHTLRTPPLRERKEDIVPLATHFLEVFARRHPDAPTGLSTRAADALMTYQWPGNIRELRAVVLSAAIRSAGDTITVGSMVEALRDRGCLDGRAEEARAPEPAGGLPQLERDMVGQAYAACEGNLSQAARRLGIPRSTLRDRLRRYGLL